MNMNNEVQKEIIISEENNSERADSDFDDFLMDDET